MPLSRSTYSILSLMVSLRGFADGVKPRRSAFIDPQDFLGIYEIVRWDKIEFRCGGLLRGRDQSKGLFPLHQLFRSHNWSSARR